MSIEMFCDRCEELIDENVPGGVRLKMGKKEYVFHLCEGCQGLLKIEVKKNFINKDSDWREIS